MAGLLLSFMDSIKIATDEGSFIDFNINPTNSPFSYFYIYVVVFYAPISCIILSLIVGSIALVRILQMKNWKLYLHNCGEYDKLLYIVIYLLILVIWPVIVKTNGFTGNLICYILFNIYISIITAIIIIKHYLIVKALERANEIRILNYE
jgi:hypothetical protein